MYTCIYKDSKLCLCVIYLNRFDLIWFDLIDFWCFNATFFNNISAISWRPDLVVEEAGIPNENHRPLASNPTVGMETMNIYLIVVPNLTKLCPFNDGRVFTTPPLIFCYTKSSSKYITTWTLFLHHELLKA